MREILFRGKRVDNGEWAEGGFFYGFNNGEPRICPQYDFSQEVIPETVEQYTGLTDKNGKKIFEGDIVKINNAYVRYVVYSEIRTCFGLLRRDSVFADEWMGTFGNVDSCNIEVIGNIYDNPELLEERK